MTQFSTLCSASTINNKIIFFNEHDSHFGGRVLCYMEDQNIQPFVLKEGNYVN